jgi:hypothetical protein
MKTLLRKNQRHRDRRATSDVTWNTSAVKCGNVRIFTGLLDVSRSKKEVQEALGRLKKNPRTAEDGKLQRVIEKTNVLVEGLESVVPHYERDLQKEDLRDLQNVNVVGLLLRLGSSAYIGQRTGNALENIDPLNDALRKAEEPGKVKGWLRSLVGSREPQVPKELIELKVSVEKTQESLQKLAREVGLDKARREEVRQKPELQLAFQSR